SGRVQGFAKGFGRVRDGIGKGFGRVRIETVRDLPRIPPTKPPKLPREHLPELRRIHQLGTLEGVLEHVRLLDNTVATN
ncbi:hypothetical protein O4106_23665, partial [Rhodococcus pyridinivorans]|nr:hypothetical protein [Rhodococcus pyridinivorans]